MSYRDRRWPDPAAEMPWTFAVPGRGHDLGWWTGLARALDGSQAQVISIEHEDPFVPTTARRARGRAAAADRDRPGRGRDRAAGGAARPGGELRRVRDRQRAVPGRHGRRRDRGADRGRAGHGRDPRRCPARRKASAPGCRPATGTGRADERRASKPAAAAGRHRRLRGDGQGAQLRAEHPSHPYAAQWWPIGQGVGYGSSFANQAADLLCGWPEEPWTPGFAEGAAVQAVCDAMATSAGAGRWVSVGEVLTSAL